VLLALALLALAWWTARVDRRVRRLLPPAGRWITLDGDRVHYTDQGQGPAIVMVHGLAGQLANFSYLPLDALAERYRIVRLDRPGSGWSTRADDTQAAIDAQARRVLAFIRALGLERPLLVGHSLGGAISLSAALQAPEAVAGLALIAPLTHMQPAVPPPFRALVLRVAAVRRFIARTLALPVALLTRDAVLRFIFAPDPVTPDFPLKGGGLLSLMPSSFYGASTDLVAVEASLPPQMQRYGELRLPVGVLYGRGDQVLNWRTQGQALCDKVPQATLTLIDGGHMIPVTAAQQVTDWLEQVALRAWPAPPAPAGAERAAAARA
jgi:pimeloyl-ACP methyl ester carboxylesterase